MLSSFSSWGRLWITVCLYWSLSPPEQGFSANQRFFSLARFFSQSSSLSELMLFLRRNNSCSFLQCWKSDRVSILFKLKKKKSKLFKSIYFAKCLQKSWVGHCLQIIPERQHLHILQSGEHTYIVQVSSPAVEFLNTGEITDSGASHDHVLGQLHHDQWQCYLIIIWRNKSITIVIIIIGIYE